MRAVTLNIQKGGVGKTSITGNLARSLSEEYRVLLVDTDPQGSLSSWLIGNRRKEGLELVDVLKERATIEEARQAVLHPGGQIDLLKTSPYGELANYGETQIFQEMFIFEDITQAAEDLGYDFLLFDTQPGLGQLAKSVLVATDEVITPVLAEGFSLDGLEVFLALEARVKKKMKADFSHNIIVVNMINRSFNRHKLYLSEYEKLKNYQLLTIPQDKNIAESQIKGMYLQDYNPESRSKAAFDVLKKAVSHDA